MTIGIWFRRDLRLGDNASVFEAFSQAHRDSTSVLAVFVYDRNILAHEMSDARLGYLKGALASLDRSLGGALNTCSGDPVEEIPRFCGAHQITDLYFTPDITSYSKARDRAVTKALSELGVRVHVQDAPTVAPLGSIRKPDGTPYRVFTPFFKAWKQSFGAVKPLGSVPQPHCVRRERATPPPKLDAVTAQDVGEEQAGRKWLSYRSTSLGRYAATRNQPALDSTSHLSVDLHFGTIHPRTVVSTLATEDHTFLSEICWREFYADVLFHNPDSVTRPLNWNFEEMEYEVGPAANAAFERWKAGETGYPIVDSAMRQLATESWMHNRTRMIVASFLVKDLHCDWRWGAKYFMSTLIDADQASNTHGWQWVAGCGTDASPYYRVFNPTLQGEKFDPEGIYVRRYLPELRDLPNSAIHRPWTVQGSPNAGGAVNGLASYPDPIVDHEVERRRALERYETLRRGQKDVAGEP